MMKIITKIVATCLILAGAQAPAMEAKQANAIGLMFHSDFCGSCKILDPVIASAKTSLSDEPILFVTFDHSSPATQQQARMLADALGVSEVYSAQKKASGFMLVVDLESKKIEAKITKSNTKEEIFQILKAAAES